MLYFDTVHNVKSLAGSDRIPFGSDSPYDHGRSAAITAALDSDSSSPKPIEPLSTTTTRTVCSPGTPAERSGSAGA
jgi:hypothetical protein